MELTDALVFAIRFKNTRSAITKEWSFSFRLNELAIQCIYRFSFGEIIIKEYTNSVFIYLPKP